MNIKTKAPVIFPLTLSTRLTFGKYKYFTIDKLIDINPPYVDWLIGAWKSDVREEVREKLCAKQKQRQRSK